MCGIFGYYLNDSNSEKNHNFIKKFKTELYQRGPDSFKYNIFNQFVIGISRLSIVDISNQTQPWELNNHITLVFNGEIYNYKYLRSFLKKKGIKLKSFSEVEVLAQLYYLYSDGFVDLIDGMYAIALFDQRDKSFSLFRDPYGIKPLYWTMQNGNFAFSSNLNSLMNCFGSLNLDLNALQEYLFHGYCSSSACIASNINKLGPSSFLKFKNNKVYTSIYESFTQKKNAANFEYSPESIDHLIANTVSEQIAEEVPMGIMLSGGIDSSLLAKHLSLNKNCPSNIKTYSVQYLDKNNSKDSLYAKKLSEELKFNHETITISSKELPYCLEKASNNLDEPISDTGIIGTNIICEKSRIDGVKVLLSGTGADELFAGYFRHFSMGFYNSKYFSELYYPIRYPISKLASIFNPSLSARISNPLANYFLSVSGMSADILNNIIINPITRWPFFSKYQKNYPINYSLFLDQKFYLPDSLLAYTDKISMANSIEIRVPYLSKSLSPLLFSYLNNKEKSRITKPLLRKVSEKYFKKEFYKRYKEGFDASVYSWPNHLILNLLNYILDYKVKLFEIGIDLKPLTTKKSNLSISYNRNLIFSLYILTKWLVRNGFFK